MIKFCKDETAEGFLASRSIEYSYEIVEATEIDVVASRKNKARPNSINEDAVSQYVDAMKNEASFPAIVLVKMIGQKKNIIASGNHRHEAATRLGAKEFYCIVVDGECSDEDFETLSKGLNAIESACPLDRKTRIEQAAAMVLNRGTPLGDAARTLSVSQAVVSDVVQAKRVSMKAAKNGIIIKDKPYTVLTLLKKFDDNEPIFNALCSYVAKRDVTRDELFDLIKSVKASKTESGKLKVIQECFNAGVSKSVSKKSVAGRPVRANVLGSIAKLENILNGRDSFPQIQIDSSEVGEVLARWKALSKKMISVLSNG